MKDEKPGGHGERSGAVGLIDAALWDLAAKAADEPLWSLLARRHGKADASSKIAVYASGGTTALQTTSRPLDDVRRARPGPSPLQDQDRRRGLASDIGASAVFGLLERGMSRGRWQRHVRPRQGHPIS
jgi:L-alanine-DL-glutamate epimerase-like enolase superfamily enzyme